MLNQRLITFKNNMFEHSLTAGEEINFFLLDINVEIANQKLIFNLPEKSKMNLFVLSINGESKKTLEITINHSGNASESSCDVKVINSKKAFSNFLIKTNVSKKLVSVKAKQNVNGVLLGPDCAIKTIPSLNIDTNNIEASHAVNIGRIDPNITFYLMTKKMSYKESYNLILEGYFSKFVDNHESLNIDIKKLQSEIDSIFENEVH